MKILKLPVLIFLTLLLISCREVPVAENINQYQAHQIINKLSSAGLNSQYETSNNAKSFSVTVSRRDYLPAVSIIAQSGILPKVDSDFQELTEPKGFLANNKNFDLLRMDRAVAVELEDALLSMPALSSAKVVVRLNSLRADQQPSISIVLGLRNHQDIRQEIIDLVKNAVPGILDQNIKLIIEHQSQDDATFDLIGTEREGGKMLAIPLVPFLIWQVPSGAEQELAWAAIGIILVAILLGYFAAILIRKPKRQARSMLNLPESGSLALGLEKDINDEGY